MTENLPPAPTLSVLETALYVDDLEAAEAFYGGLLGLAPVVKVPGRHLFFRCGRAMLLLFDPHATAAAVQNTRMPVPPHGAHGPGHVCFALSGDALEAMARRLVAAASPLPPKFTSKDPSAMSGLFTQSTSTFWTLSALMAPSPLLTVHVCSEGCVSTKIVNSVPVTKAVGNV